MTTKSLFKEMQPNGSLLLQVRKEVRFPTTKVFRYQVQIIVSADCLFRSNINTRLYVADRIREARYRIKEAIDEQRRQREGS